MSTYFLTHPDQRPPEAARKKALEKKQKEAEKAKKKAEKVSRGAWRRPGRTYGEKMVRGYRFP